MTQLRQALQAWGSDRFADTMKQEIMRLGADGLPLQQGLRHSSYASDSDMLIMHLQTAETSTHIHVRAGIAYSGLVIGCQCADDPSPDNEYPEYCEITFAIDKQTAETEIRLVQD